MTEIIGRADASDDSFISDLASDMFSEGSSGTRHEKGRDGDGYEEDAGIDREFFKEVGVPEIIVGKVIMTRMPCHLPSDVQCFTAVDNLDVFANNLHDNVNVVVFSSQGSFPSFNRMSNGDLDGDTYFVCWDQNLVKHVKEKEEFKDSSELGLGNEARSLEESKLVKQDRPSKPSMHEYLVWYYRNDNMGRINNLHLAYCDYLGKYGPSHPKSKQIAQMCSISIDFSKRGEKYIPKHALKQISSLFDHEYPDFMAKTDKKTRLSTGILGLLYRDAKLEEVVAVEQFKKFDY